MKGLKNFIDKFHEKNIEKGRSKRMLEKYVTNSEMLHIIEKGRRKDERMFLCIFG